MMVNYCKARERQGEAQAHHPPRRITRMYWNGGQDGKGWGATGSGANRGGGAGKGYGAWSGGGDAWGGAWGSCAWEGSEAMDGSDVWDWGRASPNKSKQEKNYVNCTYLGTGRHKLPHEDRCTLAGLTIDLIHDDTGVKIPLMCVASWGEKSCNGFFYLLAKAQPSTRLQCMVPRTEKFTLEAAADTLIQMWKTLFCDPAERVKQAHQILRWCVEDQERIIAEATQRGMEEDVDGVPGAPVSGTGVASVPNNTATRPLVRTDTNEEFERMKKNGHMADESTIGRDAAKGGQSRRPRGARRAEEAGRSKDREKS